MYGTRTKGVLVSGVAVVPWKILAQRVDEAERQADSSLTPLQLYTPFPRSDCYPFGA